MTHDKRIEIRHSKDPEQPFYITKVGANGEDLLVSETYTRHETAVERADQEAADNGGLPVLDTTLPD